MAEPGATLQVEGDTLSLGGQLGFSTAGDVRDAGRSAIARVGGSTVVLDLSAVEKSDSTGLALVLDWLRAARARDLQVSVRGVPEQLAEIARLGGLESLIGLAED